MLRQLPTFDDPDFLNRDQYFSDAGVYRISDTHALVQSVDFFTPVVDDPYTFGQIAAANSLSDIYAMGAKPLTALNIVAFPANCQPLEVLQQILKGGYDKVIEAGAVITGGHSIEDDEPKYGLAVTGLVEIKNLVTGEGARPGDKLVLTKPIGTGIIATAIKGGLISEKEAAEAVAGMAELNAKASFAMLKAGAHACTDITGFSLLGHLHEMLVSSKVGAVIDFSAVPLYPSTWDLAKTGMIPGGARRNLDFVSPHLSWQGAAELKDDALTILADPQTSGGLLVAVAEDSCARLLELLQENSSAAVIGSITASKEPGQIVIK